jgi:uncharacterized protein (TIGR03086 family)
MDAVRGPASTGPPWVGAELLDRAIAYTRGSLALVGPDLLTAPTPCREWDLTALLAHLADSLASLHEAGSCGEVRLAAAHGPPDVRDALRAGTASVLGELPSLAGPGGRGEQADRFRRDVLVGGRPLTTGVLAGAGALEVAVHGWDVSVACGHPRRLPDGLATALLRLAPVIVSEEDRPHRFALALPTAPDAPAGERLLAFLGRSVDSGSARAVSR